MVRQIRVFACLCPCVYVCLCPCELPCTFISIQHVCVSIYAGISVCVFVCFKVFTCVSFYLLCVSQKCVYVSVIVCMHVCVCVCVCVCPVQP